MAPKVPNKISVDQALAEIGSDEMPTEADLRIWLNSPPLQTGLDHWHLWTLICLHRHLNRQRWVGYIVETRLKGELARIGTAGALGHPEEIPQTGEVPDEPGWRYFFHGRGCCVTHAEAGASIDVDFTDDGTTERIDRYFYSNFLESLKEPEFPEQQLRRSDPLKHAWQVNVEGLANAGCLAIGDGIRMTSLGREVAEALEPIVERATELARLRTPTDGMRLLSLALMLGDLILAGKLVDGVSIERTLASEISHGCEASKERRAAWLYGLLQADSANSNTLAALSDLGMPRVNSTVQELLFRTPVDGIANTALAVLVEWNTPDLPLILERLIEFRYDEAFGIRALRRFLPRNAPRSDQMPRQHQFIRAATALLSRSPVALLRAGLKKKLLMLLDSASGATAGEAALLLYVFERRRGLECLRTALSGTVPAARTDAAAACILIGTRDAEEILMAALEHPDLELQHTAACALQRFASATACELAKGWFARLDGIDSPEGKDISIDGRTIATYSFEDVSHANMEMFLSSSLDRLREEFATILSENAGNS